SGARDATLRPLVFGTSAGGHRLAAPFIQIDRLRGDFAGGRWILANFKGSITSKAIQVLSEMALRGSVELTVRTSFARFRQGESAAVSVHCLRPKGMVEQLL